MNLEYNLEYTNRGKVLVGVVCCWFVLSAMSIVYGIFDLWVNQSVSVLIFGLFSLMFLGIVSMIIGMYVNLFEAKRN